MTARHSTGATEPTPAVDDDLLRDIGYTANRVLHASTTARAAGRELLASEPMQRLRAAWIAEVEAAAVRQAFDVVKLRAENASLRAQVDGRLQDNDVAAEALKKAWRERDEVRAERDNLRAEVDELTDKGLRAALPVLPDVGLVLRDGDRLLVAGGAGVGTSFHDDLEDDWLLLNVARNLAVLAYREQERIDGEQADTTSNDEADDLAVEVAQDEVDLVRDELGATPWWETGDYEGAVRKAIAALDAHRARQTGEDA